MVQQCVRSGNLFQPPQKAHLTDADRLLIIQVIGRTGSARVAKIQEVEDLIRHRYLKCHTARKHNRTKEADIYYEKAATLRTALTATLRDLADSPRPPLPPQDADRISEAWGSTLPAEIPEPPLHPWEPDQVERIYSGYRECGV
jgi:hypothetical protein